MERFLGKHVIGVLMVMLFAMASCKVPPTAEDSMPIAKTPTGNSSTETLPSATITSTNLAIQTPSLVLSSTQISETIRDLYLNNGGCALPCLWGISPGVTTIQEVDDRFSQIGSFKDITRSVDVLQTIAFTTVPPSDLVGVYDDDKWSLLMRVEHGVVVGIVAGVTVIEEFSAPALATFLAFLGRPEELRVRVIESMLVGENPDYEIVLYYPTKGIFIRWRGETESVIAQTEKDITVQACLQHLPTEADTRTGSFPPHFYLFSPDKNMPFDEIIERHLSEDPSGSYQPLDKSNVEKFYAMYLDQVNQDCFPFSYSFSP